MEDLVPVKRDETADYTAAGHKSWPHGLIWIMARGVPIYGILDKIWRSMPR